MEKPVEWAKGLHHSNSSGFLSIITHFLLPDDHDNAPWMSHPRIDTWGSTFSYYFKGELVVSSLLFCPPPRWVPATLISSSLLWNLVLPESFCNLASLEFFFLSFYSCLFTFFFCYWEASGSLYWRSSLWPSQGQISSLICTHNAIQYLLIAVITFQNSWVVVYYKCCPDVCLINLMVDFMKIKIRITLFLFTACDR